MSRSVIDITEICWKQVENASPKGRRVRKRGENKTRHEKQMYINSKHGVERCSAGRSQERWESLQFLMGCSDKEITYLFERNINKD